jgi:hypothetical protein
VKAAAAVGEGTEEEEVETEAAAATAAEALQNTPSTEQPLASQSARGAATLSKPNRRRC